MLTTPPAVHYSPLVAVRGKCVYGRGGEGRERERERERETRERERERERGGERVS